ncbi:MAG: hypothetical protein K0R66_529 [Gammaproteobacteria bacterium]|nr:hypothetical protein [Gammaproteobacteria bacterium]
MRTERNATENKSVRVTLSASWRVVEVSVLPYYCLEVKFVDGTKGKVNLKELITSNHAGVFAKLRDNSLFDQVCIELGVVTWPGEIDLAPDAMYEAISKNGEWIPGS